MSNNKWILDEMYEWIGDPTVLRVAAYNLSGLLYMVKSGKIASLRKDIINNIDEIVDILMKEREYKSTFFPTIISIKKGRNFWIRGYKPDMDENIKILHLILTGVALQARIGRERATILTNMEGLTLDERREYLDYLVEIRERSIQGEIYPAIDWNRLSNRVFGAYLPYYGEREVYPYIYSFAYTCEFARWLYYKKELVREDILKRKLDLITIVAGRKVPNEFAVIPGISRFIYRWFEDITSGETEGRPGIGLFIRSFYDDDQKEKSLSTINKFLYYFMNGYVSGDLLNRLTIDKVSKFLSEYKKDRKGRIYGVGGAEYFFNRIG